MTQDSQPMPDIYEALVSLAKVDREFANEIDPEGYYWGQNLNSSADQEDPVIDWPSLCTEYLEACELDDPCRQINALNAILNASAEFDARHLPKREELKIFAEQFWKPFAILKQKDWRNGKPIQVLNEIVHVSHFIDFANEVLIHFRGIR